MNFGAFKEHKGLASEWLNSELLESAAGEPDLSGLLGPENETLRFPLCSTMISD